MWGSAFQKASCSKFSDRRRQHQPGIKEVRLLVVWIVAQFGEPGALQEYTGGYHMPAFWP